MEVCVLIVEGNKILQILVTSTVYCKEVIHSNEKHSPEWPFN